MLKSYGQLTAQSESRKNFPIFFGKFKALKITYLKQTQQHQHLLFRLKPQTWRPALHCCLTRRTPYLLPTKRPIGTLFPFWLCPFFVAILKNTYFKLVENMLNYQPKPKEIRPVAICIRICYTQSPLIRTTAKWTTLEVLKNYSNLDAHWSLILQVWTLAGS